MRLKNLFATLLAVLFVFSLFGCTASPSHFVPTPAPETEPPAEAPTAAPTEPPTETPTAAPTSEPSTEAPTAAPASEPPAEVSAGIWTDFLRNRGWLSFEHPEMYGAWDGRWFSDDGVFYRLGDFSGDGEPELILIGASRSDPYWIKRVAVFTQRGNEVVQLLIEDSYSCSFLYSSRFSSIVICEDRGMFGAFQYKYFPLTVQSADCAYSLSCDGWPDPEAETGTPYHFDNMLTGESTRLSYEEFKVYLDDIVDLTTEDFIPLF